MWRKAFCFWGKDSAMSLRCVPRRRFASRPIQRAVARSLGMASLLAASLGLCACGGGSSGGAPPASDDGGPADAGDAGPDPNTYLQSLPAWPAPQPDSDKPTGPAQTSDVVGADHKSYSCTTTPYSLTKTPQQIVTFNPNAD